MACACSQANGFVFASPHPIPCGQLELRALSPPLWPLRGPLRSWRALALLQLPCIPGPVNPTGSPSRPHPHLICAFLPKMGALRPRSQFLLPLCVHPHPHPPPPCRGSQENDFVMLGWGVGAELEAELSAHTHTHSHTAAKLQLPAGATPFRLAAETPALLPTQLHTRSPPPTLALVTGSAPSLLREPSAKIKEKQGSSLHRKSWGAEIETRLSPRPEEGLGT